MRIPRIVEVRLAGAMNLWLRFDDGAEGSVDIATLIGDFRGVFEPLLSPSTFAEVRIEGNSLAWPNGADIDPLVLWAEVTGEPIVFNDGTVAPGYEDRVRH